MAAAISEAGYELNEIDPRAMDAQLLDQDEERGREALAAIFANTDLMEDVRKVNLILRIRSEIRGQWAKARDSFLSIGRALLDLEEDAALTASEKAQLKRGSDRIFPFSNAIATQLRAVARAVRDGRLSEEQCPSAYSTAYQLSVLSDDELDEARARDLVRPDVPRIAVLEFRRALRARYVDPVSRMSLERLQNQRDDLEREIMRTNAKLSALQNELEDVENRLASATLASGKTSITT